MLFLPAIAMTLIYSLASWRKLILNDEFNYG